MEQSTNQKKQVYLQAPDILKETTTLQDHEVLPQESESVLSQIEAEIMDRFYFELMKRLQQEAQNDPNSVIYKLFTFWRNNYPNSNNFALFIKAVTTTNSDIQTGFFNSHPDLNEGVLKIVQENATVIANISRFCAYYAIGRPNFVSAVAQDISKAFENIEPPKGLLLIQKLIAKINSEDTTETAKEIAQTRLDKCLQIFGKTVNVGEYIDTILSLSKETNITGKFEDLKISYPILLEKINGAFVTQTQHEDGSLELEPTNQPRIPHARVYQSGLVVLVNSNDEVSHNQHETSIPKPTNGENVTQTLFTNSITTEETDPTNEINTTPHPDNTREEGNTQPSQEEPIDNTHVTEQPEFPVTPPEPYPQFTTPHLRELVPEPFPELPNPETVFQMSDEQSNMIKLLASKIIKVSKQDNLVPKLQEINRGIQTFYTNSFDDNYLITILLKDIIESNDEGITNILNSKERTINKQQINSVSKYLNSIMKILEAVLQKDSSILHPYYDTINRLELDSQEYKVEIEEVFERIQELKPQNNTIPDEQEIADINEYFSNSFLPFVEKSDYELYTGLRQKVIELFGKERLNSQIKVKKLNSSTIHKIKNVEDYNKLLCLIQTEVQDTQRRFPPLKVFLNHPKFKMDYLDFIANKEDQELQQEILGLNNILREIESIKNSSFSNPDENQQKKQGLESQLLEIKSRLGDITTQYKDVFTLPEKFNPNITKHTSEVVENVLNSSGSAALYTRQNFPVYIADLQNRVFELACLVSEYTQLTDPGSRIWQKIFTLQELLYVVEENKLSIKDEYIKTRELGNIFELLKRTDIQPHIIHNLKLFFQKNLADIPANLADLLEFSKKTIANLSPKDSTKELLEPIENKLDKNDKPGTDQIENLKILIKDLKALENLKGIDDPKQVVQMYTPTLMNIDHYCNKILAKEQLYSLKIFLSDKSYTAGMFNTSLSIVTIDELKNLLLSNYSKQDLVEFIEKFGLDNFVKSAQSLAYMTILGITKI